ncbi:acyltransferase family protein [Desulfitobacterium sp. LBE]|uniref:acyltransferase family protein n=1 Tax=Desulfitobacterium sp. LBE TaxID=884086 RepID=UPI0032B8491C
MVDKIRKLYIDNLRWMVVLLLFPYHIFMIYNNFESFYIHGAEIDGLSRILHTLWPWMMPVLFTIAGMSSAYALQKRSGGAYLKERVLKLLVPLLFGMLLIIPVQTYLAEMFHYGSANYWNYFAKVTDLTGYAGGFTPGHLWFILYLFVISLLALPFMLYHQKHRKRFDIQNVPLPLLLVLFVVPLLMQFVLDISGKSVGEYFTFFMLGYFVLSQESVLDKTERCRLPLMAIFIAGFILILATGTGIYEINSYLFDIIAGFYAWIVILAFIGMARRHLNFQTKLTGYLSKSSFGVYLFHQSWIVVIAFFVFRITQNVGLQIALILLFSVPITFLTYNICKSNRITRWIFGIK